VRVDETPHARLESIGCGGWCGWAMKALVLVCRAKGVVVVVRLCGSRSALALVLRLEGVVAGANPEWTRGCPHARLESGVVGIGNPSHWSARERQRVVVC
jgi:hypothetical protein